MRVDGDLGRDTENIVGVEVMTKAVGLKKPSQSPMRPPPQALMVPQNRHVRGESFSLIAFTWNAFHAALSNPHDVTA